MEINITTEQKIDYIYETLQKNEKKAKWTLLAKWGFRVFIVIYLIYFIKVGLPLMIDSFIPDIPSITDTAAGINADDLKNALGEYFSN